MYSRQYLSVDTFEAAVTTSNAGTGIVTVIRESYGGADADFGYEMQGIPIASTMSTFLGFKESCLPQPGSRVLCMKFNSTYCYILGVIPEQSMGVKNIPLRGMLGAGDAANDQANNQGLSERISMVTDAQKPSDVVDGEHVVSNEFGVLLGLYQQLANLKASELSQIQCFLLDDLVRIISHNFQHYTALGEYNIYHDGKRIMAEFGATHLPKESYGSTNSPTFQTSEGASPDDSQDHYTIQQDERIKAIERFKIFLGGLGDFLNIFLVKPADEPRKLDPESSVSEPDRGLFNMQVGTDGALHLRSLKEVFIEKTNWIRVPLRKAAPDDPKGDDAENIEYEKKEKFQFDDSYKYIGNPLTYSLQLRDYVAYVNEKLGYQNFKKHEKDFEVNDSPGKEKKIAACDEVDDETKLNLTDYQLRTAGVYLMPNGGITIRDAWNSAIVLEGGNIYLQPAKDLMSLPLRHNIVKAGASSTIACRKHMDFSCSEEGIRIKAQKSMYAYSHEGGIVLESNGDTDTPGQPSPKSEAIEKVGGIVLKAKLSIYNYAEKDIYSYAKKKLFLEAEKEIAAAADKVILLGKKSFLILAKKSIRVVSRVSTWLLSKGKVICGGASKTLIGHKDMRIGMKISKAHKPEGLVDITSLIDGLAVDPLIDTTYDEIYKLTTFSKGGWQDFKDLIFKFLKSTKWGKLEKEDYILGSLAQQDDLKTGNYSLETWEEKEINETYPYPGKEKGENFYLKPGELKNLETSQEGKDLSCKADAQSSPGQAEPKSMFKDYKVQSP
jgi:hypothetical protein